MEPFAKYPRASTPEEEAMTDQKNSGSCCSTDGSCHSGATAGAEGSGVTTVYKVSGMTCGHCEGAVSQEISALDGVTAVTAVAKSGEVTVVSAALLDEEAVRAAVDEAGYEFVGTA
jgi:copper chaperone CopZ